MKITHHAVAQARSKGFALRAVALAAKDPDLAYPSRNHPGQERRIRDGICAVVDPAQDIVITVYLHRVHSPLRPDQHAA